MPPVLEGRVLTTGGVPLIYIFSTSLWMLSENWIVRGSSGGSKTSWEAIGAAVERGNDGLELGGGLERGEQIPPDFQATSNRTYSWIICAGCGKGINRGWPQGWGLGYWGSGDIWSSVLESRLVFFLSYSTASLKLVKYKLYLKICYCLWGHLSGE